LHTRYICIAHVYTSRLTQVVGRDEQLRVEQRRLA
jgi:hypothetical protein